MSDSDSDTRRRMIETAVGMFQRDGYRATSWRALVKEGGTPWGSVKHHFPGGKEELGVATVEFAGELLGSLLAHGLRSANSVSDGIRSWFAAGAQMLARSGYRDGCPVAPVVLEMAPQSAALTDACNAALGGWVAAVTDALNKEGVLDADELATAVVAGFEGALILSRARRSIDPLVSMGELMAELVGRRTRAVSTPDT